MSPKVSRPADEPDESEEPAIPPGHVPLTPAKRELKRPEPISMWWKLGGLAVVLAAIVGLVVYLSQPPDPRTSARGTAELVAESISRTDLHTFKSYQCDADEFDALLARHQVTDTAPQAGKMTVLEVSDETRDVHDIYSLASATLTSSRRPDIDTVLLLKKEQDSWCLVSISYCALDDDTTSRWLSPDLSAECLTRPGRGR
jgi:hypothetical protein